MKKITFLNVSNCLVFRTGGIIKSMLVKVNVRNRKLD